MANHLQGESSPYLRQHAHNPVDWYPWTDEALEKARREHKPIFLSIGYASCHWCHVMAHETFEDPRVAAILNEHFVSIKVDREERPDLDRIYMGAVQALTGSGGWPMSVFLTPEGQPFFGGTYYPPAPRQGMPSFSQVLAAVIEAWTERREQVLRSGAQVTRAISQRLQPTETRAPREETLQQAIASLTASYDRTYGGWGAGPKFPQPLAVELLLRYGTRSGDATALELATHALEAMARGGIYDQLGGGFHRYSVDARWLVPHFEKMLYDNALLARTYLHAWLATGNPLFRAVAEETLDFCLRELADPEGGFYGALDADTEGVEGATYLWTPDEVTAVLGPEAEGFLPAYGVTPGGNFEGRTILTWRGEGDARARLAPARARLLAARARRAQPGRDE